MRPTLRQVFAFSLLGLLLGLGLLFYLVLNGSQQTLLRSAERYRNLVSLDIGRRVTAYVDEAPNAVADFERQISHGLVKTQNADSVEHGLLCLLLANDNISEATLTYANKTGVDANGNIQTDLISRGQVAVLRAATEGQFISKRTWFDGKQYVSKTVSLTQNAPASPLLPGMDPTEHPTFQTAADTDNYNPASNDSTIRHGFVIWTDLHWSQIDESLPEAQRRVEVSAQKAIEDAQGHFAGVLRVGLMKTQIDGAVQPQSTGWAANDPHRVFICDSQGRLITGFGAQDHVTVSGDDLRIASSQAPPMVMQALQVPELKEVSAAQPLVATSFSMGDQVYVGTFRYLPGTQDWILGIVVPRAYYLGPLQQIRQQLLCALLALMAAIILSGGLIIRSAVRSHSLILRETARMNKFDFAPAQNASYLRDVADVLAGLEKAKTAMRAMSKYVPVNLVRQLYHDGEEPTLGGKTFELSVLFTDIKNFTTYAESIPPDELAEVLGRYLQVMAETIQSEKGTIDKYIGDAVMTFWNAPEPVPGHEILACRAALRCHDALQKLYVTPGWGNTPRFETRFGLHRCVATVGHFGAPDRLNYTAIGDGINLASRLEGLNKYYGTHLIASECIYAAAKDVFEFRLLDCVAVKGKTEGIVIYELVTEKQAGQPRPEMLVRYEEAFALYQRGDFTAALKILDGLSDDAPAQVLADRCREFLNHPPTHWEGIHVFDSK